MFAIHGILLRDMTQTPINKGITENWINQKIDIDDDNYGDGDICIPFFMIFGLHSGALKFGIKMKFAENQINKLFVVVGI